MSLNRRLGGVLAAGAVPLSALALGACGGGGNSATAATPAPPKTSSGKPATIGAASNSQLGKILVYSRGRTIYLFQKDKTSKSTCNGDCAAAWPPLLTTSKASASGSAKGSLLGTTKRADGKLQVTYNKHPVYLFSNDKKAGDTKGQAVNAFGAKWYVVSPSGKKIGGY